eukprot:3560319-Pyramimonas_sp.AAC.1
MRSAVPGCEGVVVFLLCEEVVVEVEQEEEEERRRLPAIVETDVRTAIGESPRRALGRQTLLLCIVSDGVVTRVVTTRCSGTGSGSGVAGRQRPL